LASGRVKIAIWQKINQSKKAAGSMMDHLREAISYIDTNRHIQAVGVVLISLISAKILEMILVDGIGRFTRYTKTDVDDKIIQSLHKPVFRTLVLLGLGIALKIEKIPDPWSFHIFASIQTLLILIWTFLVIHIVGILFSSMAQHPDRFQLVRPETLPVFEIGSKVFILGGAAYFIMISWKLDPTGWLASAGIIGIAVGFAAKDTLANLFAGVFILADAPYKVGDYIELDGQRGQVIKIGLRSTRILTRDDIEITIPNSTIAAGKIVNESGGPSIKHRLRIPIGVAYGSDVDQVRAVLQKVADSNEYVCRNPEPRVRFRKFGDSSLDFEILAWIEDPATKGLALDSLNTAIYKALAKSGIEIPFPKRDVYIKQLPK
jgi:MscS family membrane protein